MQVCVGAKLALITRLLVSVKGCLLHALDSHIDAEHGFWYLIVREDKLGSQWGEIICAFLTIKASESPPNLPIWNSHVVIGGSTNSILCNFQALNAFSPAVTSNHIFTWISKITSGFIVSAVPSEVTSKQSLSSYNIRCLRVFEATTWSFTEHFI